MRNIFNPITQLANRSKKGVVFLALLYAFYPVLMVLFVGLFSCLWPDKYRGATSNTFLWALGSAWMMLSFNMVVAIHAIARELRGKEPKAE
jgi:ABC-type Fe3+ transport system permease subunit